MSPSPYGVTKAPICCVADLKSCGRPGSLMRTLFVRLAFPRIFFRTFPRKTYYRYYRCNVRNSLGQHQLKAHELDVVGSDIGHVFE